MKAFPSAILAMMLPGLAAAQDCSIPFTVPQFGVQLDSALVYGTATRYDGGTDTLRMNIYKPIGDGQMERPLLIAIHGGGFYQGNYNDMNGLCHWFASNGWAAATISYRLGFFGNGILSPPWAYDPYEVERAIYRAMQDARGAVRFLKGRHALDSTSSTNVFLAGFSAGAITALTAGYLTEPGQKPASCGAIGDVPIFFDLHPRPDLGSIEGDLQQNGLSASVRGVVSYCGALEDTAWITNNGPALYTYAQTGDPVVGCWHQQPYYGVGFGIPDNCPWLYGACSIDQRMQHLVPGPGRYLYHSFNGNAHDVDNPEVYPEAAGWMRDLFCTGTAGLGEPGGAEDVHLYPNPADGWLFVERPETGPLPFSLLNAMGRVVRHGLSDGTPLHVGDLPAGLYWLRTGPDGRSGQRVVIAH